MKTWVRPAIFIENFQLDQHVAAACLHPIIVEEKEVLGCMHPSHVDGTAGHTWDVSDINPFTSALYSCDTKWDSREAIVAYGKKMGGDANSWGSNNHGPALNGVDVSTLFNSY